MFCRLSSLHFSYLFIALEIHEVWIFPLAHLSTLSNDIHDIQTIAREKVNLLSKASSSRMCETTSEISIDEIKRLTKYHSFR